MQPNLPPQSSSLVIQPSSGQLDPFALLLHRMINRIRQSLELPEILSTTVAEIRAFLKTDRVKIYYFHPDGTGEVIAEAIHDRRLPSLLGHFFPVEDIPQEVREQFLNLRQRSFVDVKARQVGVSLLENGAMLRLKKKFTSVRLIRVMLNTSRQWAFAPLWWCPL